VHALASTEMVLASKDIANLQPLTDQAPEEILNEIAEIQRLDQGSCAVDRI
jgi:hypothetical protein